VTCGVPGKDLLQAIKESDDYTDSWLERRLGRRQLTRGAPSSSGRGKNQILVSGT